MNWRIICTAFIYLQHNVNYAADAFIDEKHNVNYVLKNAWQVEIMKKADLAGQRFGKLTVIAPAESSATQQARWLCRCDCGIRMMRDIGTIRCWL